MAIYRANEAFYWPSGSYNFNNLPSEEGVLIDPNDNYFASWNFLPWEPPYTPTDYISWTVEIDAEWVRTDRPPAGVRVGVAFHDGALPDREQEMAIIGGITSRRLYVVDGAPETASVGYSNDVVWVESAYSDDEYEPVIIHSIRWWPSGGAVSGTVDPNLRGSTDKRLTRSILPRR